MFVVKCQILKNFSIDPLSIFYDPKVFFIQTFNSFINFKQYFHHIIFQEFTETGYLKEIKVSKFQSIFNTLNIINISILISSLIILIPINLIRRSKNNTHKIDVNYLLLIILICIFISGVFNISKHWYDAGYIYALLSILFIFFIGENYSKLIYYKIGKILFIYFSFISIISQIILISRNYYPFLNGYPGPGIPIGIYERNNIKNDIINASNICNINSIESKNLIIDDYTYWYFSKSKWPMSITYIWLDQKEELIKPFLRKSRSDGIIVNCSSMPNGYVRFMKKSGAICCISKESLSNATSVSD